MKTPLAEMFQDAERARVIERPDGYYWQTKDGARDYGPFATLIAAVQDMEILDDEESPEEGESLREAEAEIGMSDWIDPETGEPAEGIASHLEEH
jgi:hypothetical protein